MTRKSFGMLSAALVCAAAVSISISSCDNNNSPTTPGSNSGIDRSKGPQVLQEESRTLVQITETPEGNTSFEYNRDGDLVVNGLNGTPGNAVGCTFQAPVNVWHIGVDAKFTRGSDGELTVDAQDDAGHTEASVTIKSAGNDYVAVPQFTSAPGGGDPQYDVTIFDNGAPVASQLAVKASEVVRITAPACTLNVTAVDWDVFQVDKQCIWKIKLNPCCLLSFRLPNGTVVSGNQIQFIERNSKGVYVYLETKKVNVKGNLASYSVQSASAYRTQ